MERDRGKKSEDVNPCDKETLFSGVSVHGLMISGEDIGSRTVSISVIDHWTSRRIGRNG